MGECSDNRRLHNEILNGPFMGGVDITDEAGNKIEKDRLTSTQIQNFLRRELQLAKKRTDELINGTGQDGSQPPAAVQLVEFSKQFDTNMDEAISRVTVGDYEKALSALQKALAVPPTMRVSASTPEFTLDMRQMAEQIQTVMNPLQNAHNAMQWLVATRGQAPEGPKR
jgi:predicted Zn-dependent protease